MTYKYKVGYRVLCLTDEREQVSLDKFYKIIRNSNEHIYIINDDGDEAARKDTYNFYLVKERLGKLPSKLPGWF